MRIANTLLLFLENVGAGVWVGALLTFGFAVVAPLFRGLPSVTLAGSIAAHVLHRLNLIEAGAATVMAVAALAFLAQADHRTPLRLSKTALLVLMIMVLIYYGTVIMNRMEHLRTVEIRDFDHFDVATQAFRDEFDRLHRLYTQLVGANLLMGLGFLLLSAFEKKEV